MGCADPETRPRELNKTVRRSRCRTQEVEGSNETFAPNDPNFGCVAVGARSNHGRKARSHEVAEGRTLLRLIKRCAERKVNFNTVGEKQFAGRVAERGQKKILSARSQ
jgi:hypothetical protein